MERDPSTLSVGARRAPIRPQAIAERVRALARSEDPALSWSALGVMLVVAAAFLYYETRGTTFWFDEWTWALTRRGSSLGTFLDAHNGHLSLVPVLIYKLLFATAGLRTYAPYRIVAILAHLGCATLLFAYARRRVGGLLAAAAAAVLLFFGPGWQDILWPFQVAWLISIGAGIGALLMLDRGDGLGRGSACALLAASLASSSVGVAFAIGILVELLLRPRERRHWWIVGGPLALYVLWSIGYQNTTIAAHGFVVAPDFAFNAAGAALAAVLGFGGGLVPGVDATGASLQSWGQALAVVALALMLWRLPRLGRSPARALGLLAAGASFWFLTGLTRWYISAPDSSRYLYVGGVIVLLLMVELAAGLRIGWIARAVIAAVALVAVITNIGDMRAAGNFLRAQAQTTRAEVGALDIARPIVAANYTTGPFGIYRADQYFATERAIGTPAATAGQIAAFAEPARDAADSELAAIHGLRLVPVSGSPAVTTAPPLDAVTGGTAAAGAGCTRLEPAQFNANGVVPAISVTIPPAGVVVRTGQAAAAVGYRRFGVSFQNLGTLAPLAQAELRIGPDLASTPWHLQVSSEAPVSICSLAQ